MNAGSFYQNVYYSPESEELQGKNFMQNLIKYEIYRKQGCICQNKGEIDSPLPHPPAP